MNTQTLKMYTHTETTSVRKPVTARGRALYTTAWFLHGKTAQRDYDNRSLGIRGI